MVEQTVRLRVKDKSNRFTLFANCVSFVNIFAELIYWTQTFFSLPWLISALAVARISAAGPGISASKLLVGSAGFLFARTSAMSLNRWLDQEIDGRNPRTAQRALPAGRVDSRAVLLLGVIAMIGFWLSCAVLGRACLLCALTTSPFMVLYSLCKRFTWTSHLVLGGVQAMLPVTVGAALTGQIRAEQILLGLALGCNVAAMDILYALEDRHIDREQNLLSIPALFGTRSALWWTRALHAGTAIFLLYLGLILQLPAPYFAGLLLLVLSILWGHWSVARQRALTQAQFAAGNGLAGAIVMISLLGVLAWRSM